MKGLLLMWLLVDGLRGEIASNGNSTKTKSLAPIVRWVDIRRPWSNWLSLGSSGQVLEPPSRSHLALLLPLSYIVHQEKAQELKEEATPKSKDGHRSIARSSDNAPNFSAEQQSIDDEISATVFRLCRLLGKCRPPVDVDVALSSDNALAYSVDESDESDANVEYVIESLHEGEPSQLFESPAILKISDNSHSEEDMEGFITENVHPKTESLETLTTDWSVTETSTTDWPITENPAEETSTEIEWTESTNSNSQATELTTENTPLEITEAVTEIPIPTPITEIATNPTIAPTSPRSTVSTPRFRMKNWTEILRESQSANSGRSQTSELERANRRLSSVKIISFPLKRNPLTLQVTTSTTEVTTSSTEEPQLVASQSVVDILAATNQDDAQSISKAGGLQNWLRDIQMGHNAPPVLSSSYANVKFD